MSSRRYTKYENELEKVLAGAGWLPVRSTGSLGVCDVVAATPKVTLFIEVKSSRETRHYLNGEARKKHKMLWWMVQRGFNVIYAFRHIGSKEWYAVPVEEKPPIFDISEMPHLESLLQAIISCADCRGKGGNQANDANTGGVEACSQLSM